MLSTIFIVSVLLLKVVYGAKYSTGEDADKLCKAYKKICPSRKICVVQNLYWPRKMSFPVCVHEREVPAKAKICELPPSPGGCGARFRRWYFNVHTKECSPLTYSGCEGNLNNFHSKDKCEDVCEVTSLEKDVDLSAPEIISLGITSRTPDVLAAPAPLRLQPSSLREALELEDNVDIEINGERKLRRRKHRRGGHRNPNGKRQRRRRRRHRKHRKYGSSLGRYAELRGRKTSFFLPPHQSDQTPRFLLRQLRKKQQGLEKARRYSGYDGYYDKIRLFTLLGAKGRRRRSRA